MRPVYAISGGVSKFAKARPDKTFQAIIKEAYDYAIADSMRLEIPGRVLEVGVVAHHERVLAAQLEGDLLDRRGGRGHQRLAGLQPAGEGDQVDPGVRGQGRALGGGPREPARSSTRSFQTRRRWPSGPSCWRCPCR